MWTTFDFFVLFAYLLASVLLGLWAGRRQQSATDYFLGNRSLPWGAVCLSVVATETSTLTVIGIPAVAYGGNLSFWKLTLGYVLGRVLVSVLLLPRYYERALTTAYGYLGMRFGEGMRTAASLVFLGTRLLADGVRLFATAIPIKVIADQLGLATSYLEIILVVAGVTVLYTLIGGLRAVVWLDVMQLFVYLGGALATLIVLGLNAPDQWWSMAAQAGKTQLLVPGAEFSPLRWLTEPYVFVTAVIGGAVFSMASHGTDHLMVQRLLACRTLRDSQKALIGSGILVMGQFALFLLVGLLLWVHYGGASPQELGLSRTDEVFPHFIIEGLPPGISGLLLASILAAAMSTLSSSLNALASSTLFDLYERWRGRTMTEQQSLRVSRWLTLGWALVFVGFASLFESTQNPVVELGLSIASFTYGGLLGAFLLGRWNPKVSQRQAIVAFVASVGLMALIVLGVWLRPDGQVVLAWRPDPVRIAAEGLRSLAWPWYTLVGALLTLGLGSFPLLRHSFKH
ncbi:sodium:solute symporter [Rhodothermus bifroesti]|uniref:sodium:solute symporter n=1 Tax=Rhodothermus bifroesti TaxID=2823335 RepID=UPI001AEFEB50